MGRGTQEPLAGEGPEGYQAEGFHYSPPLPAEEISAHLAAGSVTR